MIDLNKLNSSNTEYFEEVKILAKEATDFLESQEWCKKIVNGYYDRGWGYILCIFYFKITPINKDVDNAVWIIVGDLPPAYIDIATASNGSEALQAYVRIMREWISNIKNGFSVQDSYPIAISPTIEHANMLETRLNLIEEDFLR